MSKIYWFSRWPNIFVENDSVTCRRASSPILLAIAGSWISLAIAKENFCGVGSQRNPVSPSLIVSTGPPLLHAITGLWAAMDSNGTIPKCSSYNNWTFRYKTHIFFSKTDQFHENTKCSNLWCIKYAQTLGEKCISFICWAWCNKVNPMRHSFPFC